MSVLLVFQPRKEIIFSKLQESINKFNLSFFQSEIPNSNFPKYLKKEFYANQRISNFLEVPLLQIQISPNIP